MIKGHSGSGPRNADQDQPFLRLTEDPYHSESSESPQSPTISLSPDHDDLYHTSAMRGPAFHAPDMEPYPYAGRWYLFYGVSNSFSSFLGPDSTMNHARSSSPYSSCSLEEYYTATYHKRPNQSHGFVECETLYY